MRDTDKTPPSIQEKEMTFSWEEQNVAPVSGKKGLCGAIHLRNIY